MLNIKYIYNYLYLLYIWVIILDGDCVVALYDFKGNNSHELDFNKNDKITILDWHAKEGWAYGFIHNQSNAHVKKGLIPKLFIEMIPIEKHEIGETKKGIYKLI